MSCYKAVSRLSWGSHWSRAHVLALELDSALVQLSRAKARMSHATRAVLVTLPMEPVRDLLPRLGRASEDVGDLSDRIQQLQAELDLLGQGAGIDTIRAEVADAVLFSLQEAQATALHYYYEDGGV